MSGPPAATGWDGEAAAAALAASRTALWSWRPQADRLVFTGGVEGLGLAAAGSSCSAKALAALVAREDRSALARLLKPRAGGTELEARVRLTSGETLVWRGAWGADGGAAGTVALDRSMERQETDRLTGLLLRRSFIAGARERLAEPGAWELVVADLDRLRRLNEALGHERADLVLAALGARLKGAFPEALCARVGEDEFAVLTPAGDGCAEALRAALEAPMKIAGFDIFPTLAVGAVSAEGGPDAAEATELLRRAELAVEAAKTAGRGGGAAYVRALESDGLSRLALEADLRAALERGEIEPFFQPIVRLDTGRIAGFEALMRWRHPRRGLLPPDDFLGMALETGLLGDLGWHVMGEAAAQLAAWRRAYPRAGELTVSVNLSTEELQRPGLVEQVRAVLGSTDLPRGALKLELTESQIMKDPERAGEVLRGLREAGAGLALDDFGTGFSSLSWLSRLPFDTLKIDRYFVRTLRSNEGSAKIVRSVAKLGRDLFLEVVAEGVENRALAELLLSMGCHYGQGFGWAPALSAEEAEAYLADSCAAVAEPLIARA